MNKYLELAIRQKLKDNNIYARRYFHPLISEFTMYNNFNSANPKDLQNAIGLSDKVICLPIYSNLKNEELNYIIYTLKE